MHTNSGVYQLCPPKLLCIYFGVKAPWLAPEVLPSHQNLATVSIKAMRSLSVNGGKKPQHQIPGDLFERLKMLHADVFELNFHGRT